MMSGDQQQRALAALESALFEEVAARFRVVLVSEYGELPAMTGPQAQRPRQRVGPQNLDGAVTAFDRGLDDLIAAYGRCRDVVAKHFPLPDARAPKKHGGMT